MHTALLALATAAMLGFLHALEVDHMIAVTSFVSTRPALRTAAVFGVRWGVGHSLSVFIAGGILLLTGLRWPARFDQAGEVVVGAMLIGLGAWAIRASRKLHLHAPAEHGDHLHLHAHRGSVATHQHSHHHHHSPPSEPEEGHGRHHSHGITLVGMLHGLSGTSAVVALIPVTLMSSALLGLGYLVAFGVGVTAGMTVYAVVAAGAMRTAAERSLVWGRRISAGVGIAGIGVGLWWVVTALN